jgi:hypothetical protein
MPPPPFAKLQKTKGPASWGQVLGGYPVALPCTPPGMRNIANSSADLWPNLAKQVQTFWRFAVNLYFKTMRLSLLVMDPPPRARNAQSAKPNLIVGSAMSYLSNVVSERPMVRVSASVILAFCFAAPLVWLFSNLVVYGLRSFL